MSEPSGHDRNKSGTLSTIGEKKKQLSSLSKESVKSSKSKSRSPEKSDSRVSKSSKSKRVSSKSPKRKVTGKDSKRENSSNNLTNSTEAFKSTPELEDLSYQGLTVLTSKIFQKTTLRKLILTGNNLRAMPTTIIDLVNLEHLDLSKNPLKVKDVDDSNCLPLEMRHLKNLKYLNISECNLRYIPTTVWLCVSVKMLDLSRNKISLLVPDVGNLQNLTHINLSQCNLTTLPGEIGFCSELTEITLMANNIESLPDSLHDCKNLKYLRMSYRNFNIFLDAYMENLISKGQIKSEHIPMVIFELENLRSLDLKNTKINSLPENNLLNLEEIYLDHNYFDSFLDGSLKPMNKSLKVLTMSHNLLKEIPAEVLNVANLEVLDVSFNDIVKLPTYFNLFNLKELYLTENKVDSIENIGLLRSLEKLALDKNELTELSESLFELVNLVYLDLSYNKLTTIPPTICKLVNLKVSHSYEKLNKTGLWVIGNPLVIPTKEIWQTQNIGKIYDFLSNYVQRNLNYVFYSKLVFLGQSGLGKSTLIDSFFNSRSEYKINSDSSAGDHKTKIARKLYKRTPNKVEWLILDFGGDETYRPIHSTIFSSIDHENEPTLFVLVYNHTNYASNNHHDCLGSWIESILMHSKVSENSPIQIKLIGIVNSEDTELDPDEEELKKKQIIENCILTVSKIHERLVEEKAKLENLLANFDINLNSKENLEYLKSGSQLLDSLLKRNVNINQNILLVEDSIKKETSHKVMLELEKLTIKFNKIVPLDLRSFLKNHIIRLRQNRIKLDDLISNLKSSKELTVLMGNNPQCSLNINKVVNYAKTIGEIFWLKYNSNLNKDVFLRYSFILNCMQLFIRHDLYDQFLYSDNSVIKSVGYSPIENEFKKSLYLLKNYGIIEDKIIKGLCFVSSQLTRSQIDDSISLLRDLSYLYESKTEYTEERCSFYQIVVPSLCSKSFDEEKRIKIDSENFWNSDLYSDDFELFFEKIDKMRAHREHLKKENGIIKDKIMWNIQESLNLGEYYKEDEDVKKLEIINLDEFIKTEYMNVDPSKKDDKSVELAKARLKYANKCIIECVSLFELEKHLFDHFSALIQNITYERFDWNDTIIGRTVDDCCFKIKLVNEPDAHKINIELKCIKLESMVKIKEQLVKLIDDLFNFYPGLYFYKKVELK